MWEEERTFPASCQEIYFALPEDLDVPFYIRIFDPDCGGRLDVGVGLWETNTRFSFYGGEGCLTGGSEPRHSSGELLAEKLFAREKLVDNQWVPIGPFHTERGETLGEYPGYAFFKIIVSGRTGNDGNQFSVYLSLDADRNLPLSGAAIFQYEAIYMNGEKLARQTFRSEETRDDLVILPVKLKPIPPGKEYKISVEPVDDE